MMELPKETEISTHFLSDIPLYFIQYLVKNNIDLNDFVVKKTVTLNTEETCQHALKIIDIAAFIDDYISHEISLTSLMSCYREVENSVSAFERHTLKTARQELDKALNSIKEIKLQLMSSIEYRSIYESLLGISSPMDFMSKKPMAMPEDTYENKDELLKFLDETKKTLLDLHSFGVWNEEWYVSVGMVKNINNIYRTYSDIHDAILSIFQKVEKDRAYICKMLDEYISKVRQINKDINKHLKERFVLNTINSQVIEYNELTILISEIEKVYM